MRENSLMIVDEQGKEVEMIIKFTCDFDDTQYVVVYPEDNEEDLYAFEYDNDGNLYAVDDEEILGLINEVLEAYEQEKE